MVIETIVFDIGETLTRDDRYWRSWADWLDVPRHTVSALVGAVVTQGRDNTDALRILRPDIDVGAEYRAREAAGRGEYLDETDLYPDVRPVLAGLRKLGVRVLVAGNQTEKAGILLRALDLPADLVVTSAEWGSRSLIRHSSSGFCRSPVLLLTRRCTSVTTLRATCSRPRRPDCGLPTFAADRGGIGGATTRTSLRPRTGPSTHSQT